MLRGLASVMCGLSGIKNALVTLIRKRLKSGERGCSTSKNKCLRTYTDTDFFSLFCYGELIPEVCPISLDTPCIL